MMYVTVVNMNALVDMVDGKVLKYQNLRSKSTHGELALRLVVRLAVVAVAALVALAAVQSNATAVTPCGVSSERSPGFAAIIISFPSGLCESFMVNIHWCMLFCPCLEVAIIRWVYDTMPYVAREYCQPVAYCFF